MRRLASAIYEILLLAAVVFIATWPFIIIFGDSTHGWRRNALQAWVVFVCGVYFVSFWTRGGQTLPMKTWRMRIVRRGGGPIAAKQAIQRYGFATLLGFGAFGLGFLWALVDRDRQFLHDRLAGTAIVDVRGEVPVDAQRLSAR
jgi:uncharacterized RDD family membrane protein YckC